jgi:hypothetical protein
MSFVLDRIKAAIIAQAEGQDDYTKIGYGNPAGNQIQVEGVGWFARGKAWLSDLTAGTKKGLLDLLLENIANEIGRTATQMCTLNVNGSSVAPTIAQNSGIASVSKHETGVPPLGACDYIEFTLDEQYVSTGYLVTGYVYDASWVPRIRYLTYNTFRLYFYDPYNALADMNHRFVGVTVVGIAP